MTSRNPQASERTEVFVMRFPRAMLQRIDAVRAGRYLTRAEAIRQFVAAQLEREEGRPA